MASLPIIIITGPTAAGKTAIALQVARQLDAEIISVDSRQIYKFINIGTGKPTAEQLKTIPHHLISCVDPHLIITADSFSKLANQACKEIQSRGKRCLLVGGTGLWIRAFIDGLAPVPPGNEAIRAQLRERVVNEGKESLHELLQSIDPISANRVNSSDILRIIRALEIHYTTGQKASDLLKKPSLQEPVIAIWLAVYQERQTLYRLAENRIDYWLETGWLAEVRALLDQGIISSSAALQAIGYKQLVEYLQNGCSYEQAVMLIKRNTRRYIKRQFTWLRSEKRLTWFENKCEEATVKEIFGYLATLS